MLVTKKGTHYYIVAVADSQGWNETSFKNLEI